MPRIEMFCTLARSIVREPGSGQYYCVLQFLHKLVLFVRSALLVSMLRRLIMVKYLNKRKGISLEGLIDDGLLAIGLYFCM